MRRMSALFALGVGVVLFVSAKFADAVDFQWRDQNTGDQVWRSGDNWDVGGFPDSDEDAADLSVNLASDLNASLGAGVTLARLSLGGTGAPVTTTLSGGTLRLEAFEENARIISGGSAGAVNTITAPIYAVNEQVEFGASSTNNLSLGDFAYEGQSALRSFMPSGLHVSVNNVLLEDSALEEGQEAMLFLNDSADNQGTLEIRGVIEGSGELRIGPSNAEVAMPLSTVILNGDNTFSGGVSASRANLVLGHDNALGTGRYRQGQQSNQFGANLISDDDSRKISNAMGMSQWQTVRGEHSLEWAGDILPTNSRGFVNLLPEGKQLTISGNLYAAQEADNLDRRFRFDGSGTTVVTSGLQGFAEIDVAGFSAGHHKNGTGVLLVNGASTYDGETQVNAGTLRFADAGAYGNTSSIVVNGGAVGVDTGTFSDFDFMFLLDPDSRGGLILAPSEADLDIDVALEGATGISIAGPETGITYTGTITPANNTYRLGGGAGTITLPNDNQLTGNRSNVATNGGLVRISGTNNYTGATRVEGQYTTTVQEQARVNERNGTSDQLFVPTTLSVQHLADGNVASGIGQSSSDAANLVIQGAVLRYEGEGGSTNRLFTIGTAGATLDASGSGPIEFTNASSIATTVAQPREGSIRGIRVDNGLIKLTVEHTEDLVIGMGIQGLDNVPENATVASILDDETVEMSQPVPDNPFLFERGTVTFAGVDRTLTLTGSNLGRNTLTPVIADADDQASVHLAKSGSGTWVVAGNNSYTGTTSVQAGTLLVDGEHQGGDVYEIANAGTLGGVGQIGADVFNAGTLMAAGGTLTIDGGLTFADGGTLLVDLADLTTDVPLLALADVDLLSTDDYLEVTNLGAASPGDYLLATYDGALAGMIDNVAAGLNLKYDNPGQILLTVLGDVLRGDFNGDGEVGLADIDLLTPAIASGDQDLAFDLNGDSVLNGSDLERFLTDGVITAGNRLRGDTDLNGEVDFADFLKLSGNFGQAGVWSQGDFDANGMVEFADFLSLSSNFGSSATAASVPEPEWGAMWLLLVLALGRTGAATRRR